jgi:hypothetical protein
MPRFSDWYADTDRKRDHLPGVVHSLSGYPLSGGLAGVYRPQRANTSLSRYWRGRA